MHDNPQALPGLAFALPDHHVIALSGRDASAFAQAQFMSDVQLLAPGRWQWSGWLTPKGRVVALFALLKFDDENLWLLVTGADPVTFAAALQRFVFRSKVALAVRDDLRVEGAFVAPVRAHGNEFGGDAVAGVELDFGGDGGPRTLRILRSSGAQHDATRVAHWAVFDLEHGLPRLAPSQSDHWTPQQLSLERLNAFSVKKGCYPGQEIVARTHFLGKAKRGLALVEGGEALQAAGGVTAAGQPLGHLVASAGYDGRHVALAVVPLEHDSHALAAGGIEVRERPLLEGLAR